MLCCFCCCCCAFRLKNSSQLRFLPLFSFSLQLLCVTLLFISFTYKSTKFNHFKWREWLCLLCACVLVCCVCVNGTMHNLLFLTFSIAIDYIRWTTMWSLLNIILTIHANVSVFNAIIITKMELKTVRETEILHVDRTTWENKESEIEWRTTTKNGKKEGDLHSR